MAYPQDILDHEVSIYVDGAWVDITTDVFGRDGNGLEISRGATSEGQQTEPGSLMFQLNNTGGKYVPTNPNSPYYKKIGRSTKIRTGPHVGPTYAWLDPEAATIPYYASADQADYDILGDIDIRFDAALTNWQSAKDPFYWVDLIGKYNSSTNWSYYLNILGGDLVFHWTPDGTTANQKTATSTVPFTVPPNGRLAVRVTLDVNNGAGGNTVVFYTSDTINGVWTQLGDPIVQSGVTSIFNSTANLRVANGTQLTVEKARGRLYAAQVRNGIDGTIVAYPDFTILTDGQVGIPSDVVGKTWGSNGPAEITNRQTRFVGRVVDWPAKWQEGHKDPYVAVEAAGIMRRLGSNTIPLDSAMRREFSRPNRVGIIGYWPMEDEDGATTFAPGIPGINEMRFNGDITPGANNTYGPSKGLPTFNTGACSGKPLAAASTGEVTMRFALIPPSTNIAADSVVASFQTSSSTLQNWVVRMNTSGQVYLRIYDGDGVAAATSSAIDVVGGKSYSVNVRGSNNGSNVDWQISVIPTVPESLLWLLTPTASGTSAASSTVGKIVSVKVGAGSSKSLGGTAIGHLVVANEVDAFSATAGAICGWVGERPAARFLRLMSENEITSSREVDEGSVTVNAEYDFVDMNTLMGNQGELTLLGALRECEESSQGILYESKWHSGLILRDNKSLSNQTAMMTLDYSANSGIVTPFEPVTDDQQLVNWADVSRVSGGTGTYVKEAGPLNVSEPEDDPEGAGVYRKGYTLDLAADEQAVHHAGWLVHLGTWDETRYPKIKLLLQKIPNSVNTVCEIDVGDVIELNNLPESVFPRNTRLIVRGYSERITQYEWEVNLTCVPAGPYDMPDLDAPNHSRLADIDTVTVGALDTTETEVDIWTPTGPTWIEAGGPLNTNIDYASGTTGFIGVGLSSFTIVSGASVPGPGIPTIVPRAARAVPDGSTSNSRISASPQPVNVGDVYRASAWVRSDTAHAVSLNINWLNSGGSFLSTSVIQSGTATPKTWQWYEGTATAPASAAFAQVIVQQSGASTAADIFHVQQQTLRYAGTSPALSPQEFPFDAVAGGEVMRIQGIAPSSFDDFSINVAAGGWGNGDVGGPWAIITGTASVFSVTGGRGLVSAAATNTNYAIGMAAAGPDVDISANIQTPALALTQPQNSELVARATSINDMYMARLAFGTGGVVTASLRKRVGGVDTQLAAVTYAGSWVHAAATPWAIRFKVEGSALKMKAWPVGAGVLLEPAFWHLEATDTDITATGSVGVRNILNSGNTNTLPFAFSWDAFQVNNPQKVYLSRSINGIVKSHSSGVDFKVQDPMIIAI